MAKTPHDVDAYLDGLEAPKRSALEHLRRSIHAAAPGAEECISYGVPAFRVDGRIVVWMAAAAKHCSFFPGAHPIETHREALAKYSTSKGTVRFPPDRPLPATLVRKLVRTRIAELARPRRRRGGGR